MAVWKLSSIIFVIVPILLTLAISPSNSSQFEIDQINALYDVLLALNDSAHDKIKFEYVGVINATSLHLASRGFTGILSPAVTKLEFLEILDLHDNNLAGPLPDVGSMKNLKFLNLANNRFNGTIPPNWGRISSSLKYLDLSSNNLSGKIPIELFSGPIIFNFSGTHLTCGNDIKQPCASQPTSGNDICSGGPSKVWSITFIDVLGTAFLIFLFVGDSIFTDLGDLVY